MDFSVAAPTQRDQVPLNIITQAAAGVDMVNF
jgi:hypothetical protein